MTDFPQLPRDSIQFSQEVGPDGKEMWKPSWRCFCCHDTGKIEPTLVRLVIPDYDDNKDKIPICQNCNAGSNWMHLQAMIDTRIDFKVCRRLDQFERENWKQTRQAWFERAKERVESATRELSQKANMRLRDRNQQEEQIAKYQHDLARNDRHEIDEIKAKELAEVD